MACILPAMELSIWPDKMFLSWYEGQWYHRGSDQKYRGEVFGHLGPIPSMRMRDLHKRTDKKFAIGKYPEIMHGCFTGGPFNTIKEATETWGEEDQYIAKIVIGEEPKVIRKWITSTWERIK